MFASYKPPTDIDHWIAELIGLNGYYPHGLEAEWLRARIEQCDIKVMPEPQVVTVRKFEMNWQKGSGTFAVAMNGVELPQRFDCKIEGDGWPHYYVPCIQSANGLQAQYSAYVLTAETKRAIERAVRRVLPRLKPYGIDKTTGLFCTQLSSMNFRGINSSRFVTARERVERAGFAETERITRN